MAQHAKHSPEHGRHAKQPPPRRRRPCSPAPPARSLARPSLLCPPRRAHRLPTHCGERSHTPFFTPPTLPLLSSPSLPPTSVISNDLMASAPPSAIAAVAVTAQHSGSRFYRRNKTTTDGPSLRPRDGVVVEWAVKLIGLMKVARDITCCHSISDQQAQMGERESKTESRRKKEEGALAPIPFGLLE